MINFKKDVKFDIIGMGEVMLRLSPPDKETISQSDVFLKNAGGSELNVVSDAAMLGASGCIITKLPDSKIGRFVRNIIRYTNVCDDYIVYDKSQQKRLGIYYYESGAYPRKSSVVYDRKNSSVCSLKMNELSPDVFNSTKIFHLSSITLALDNRLSEEVCKIVKEFKKSGAKISFDVNYRASLWCEEDARNAVEKLLPLVDFLFISEETSRRMMRRTGSMNQIMQGFSNDFGCSIVASTKRKVITPNRHDFSSVIYHNGKFYEESAYEGIEVIDRVGSGDAYVAGVLFGLVKYGDISKALETGNALSALKNTVVGDMSPFSPEEVQTVIDAHKTAEFGGEMER